LTNNERLQKWTLVSEIVGACAIVLSLMIVAYELRQNTEASYATSHDTLSEAQFNWRNTLLSTPGLLEEWSETLEVQIEAGELIGEQLLLIYERAYFAHKYGRLGDAEWERYRGSICHELIRKIMPGASQSNFTQEFWGFVSECTSATRPN